MPCGPRKHLHSFNVGQPQIRQTWQRRRHRSTPAERLRSGRTKEYPALVELIPRNTILLFELFARAPTSGMRSPGTQMLQALNVRDACAGDLRAGNRPKCCTGRQLRSAHAGWRSRRFRQSRLRALRRSARMPPEQRQARVQSPPPSGPMRTAANPSFIWNSPEAMLCIRPGARAGTASFLYATPPISTLAIPPRAIATKSGRLAGLMTAKLPVKRKAKACEKQ